jgi:hypothetical protein
MVQELLILPEHMSSPPVVIGDCVAQSLVFSIVFCRPLFVLFVLFVLVIELSVFIRFTASDYLFGIFKLLLSLECNLKTYQKSFSGVLVYKFGQELFNSEVRF